jgi:2-polyprenyl-6-methoxyphenol hydroxylase-like FAD-dependent oxidoreductase
VSRFTVLGAGVLGTTVAITLRLAGHSVQVISEKVIGIKLQFTIQYLRVLTPQHPSFRFFRVTWRSCLLQAILSLRN